MRGRKTKVKLRKEKPLPKHRFKITLPDGSHIMRCIVGCSRIRLGSITMEVLEFKERKVLFFLEATFSRNGAEHFLEMEKIWI